MSRMKIAEAIRIINEREKVVKTGAKRERQKERLHTLYQKQKVYRKRTGLPWETKAELIEKECPCGRRFKVLTYHKGVNRKLCRVCKPY